MSQNEVYYYSYGERVFLQQYVNKVLILLSHNANREEIYTRIINDGSLKLGKNKRNDNFIAYIILESKDMSAISASTFEYFQNRKDVISVSFMLEENGILTGLTNEIVVKLKATTSYEQLNNLAIQNHCVVGNENGLVKNQFMISVPKLSDFNALEMANLFYETGLFEYSCPDFIMTNGDLLADPLYSSQWGLKNIGQNGGVAGVDIKIEAAWAITQGNPNIKVAVIDQGVDLTHPDLAANLLPGYDASGANGAGAAILPDDDHGTPCAGVIGAIKNNGIGISGVAPNCKIIPIRRTAPQGVITPLAAANSLEWAWRNGADVISISFLVSDRYPPMIEAVDSAFKYGRNGLRYRNDLCSRK